MPRPRKRNWKLRFSLKTLLVFCFALAIGIGWLTNSYREYLAEQKLISALMERQPEPNEIAASNPSDPFFAFR